MSRESAERDWEGYYRSIEGRAPRPLLALALECCGAAGEDGAAPVGRFAIDLGCGDGTETRALLAQGWRVRAIDQEPAAINWLLARVPPQHAARLETEVASFATAVLPPQGHLPPADLILACASLPFCPAPEFPLVWERLRAAVKPGGRLAVQFFGERDDWSPGGRAPQEGMIFQSRAAVEALAAGLALERLEETERDGPSGLGPKHWHAFDLIARKPA